MTDTNQDLERFRQEWREEVTARVNKGKGHGAKSDVGRTGQSSMAHAGGKSGKGPASKSSLAKKDDNDRSEMNGGHQDRSIDGVNWEIDVISDSNTREPRSALEHYERAVEKENQGNLGDSLNHYRKAYKLDSSVEKTYKEKYFTRPSSTSSKPTDPNPSNAAVTVPNPVHHSLQGPSAASSSSISDLINSFSTFSFIPTASPSVPEGPPLAPCPISTVPSEVLIEILLQVALLDLSSFVCFAQVCKRLAFLVATEQRIWRRLCCGWEVGFGGMHYRWACDVFGQPLDNDHTTGKPPTYLPVPLTPLYPTYKHNLRYRPRIRFNGCYISTVNYVRPGATSVTQVSWNSPVHIVTYYRYLRFFRDGTVISLQTTTEPIDVVHHLTKENLPDQSPNSNTLRSALRGRWKLGGHPLSPSEEGREEEDEEEGKITIETEGVDPVKHMYLMHLSLRPSTVTAGAGADAGGGVSSTTKSNNKINNNKKLVWRGFWSYNRLTDDWFEFGLKNDRPFWWSRVRSYGMG